LRQIRANAGRIAPNLHSVGWHRYQRVRTSHTATTTTEGVSLMSGEDKMNNKLEEMGGKAKEALGDATDDRDLQAAGQRDQTKSNLKQAGEKVKDAFK
jgi:uncharacterized protein YjbJ (UPF0337 family)